MILNIFTELIRQGDDLVKILPSLPDGQNPCRDCPNRKVGCHTKCEAYKEFKEKLSTLRRNQRYQITGSSRSAEIHANYCSGKNSRKAVFKLFDRMKKKDH